MSPAEFISQLRKPYWSAQHPSEYVRVHKSAKGTVIRSGWGLFFPDEIGVFNIVWLLSGVRHPPADYGPHFGEVDWALRYARQDVWLSGLRKFAPLEEVATRPLGEFALIMSQQHVSTRRQLHRLYDALKVRT